MKRLIWVLVVLAVPVVLVRVATATRWLPVWRVAVEREIPGDASHARGHGGGTLLVPEDPDPVERFSSGPWTYGWINFLQQELGPYGIASPSSLPDAGGGPWIVPRVLAQEPWPELLQHRGPGTTVVECPGPGWGDILGSTEPATPPRMERIHSDLLAAPIRTVLVVCPPGEIHGEVLARTESGQPLIWSVEHAGTRWLGLGFDLAHSILAAQQGVPSEDLLVENRFPARHGDRLQTSDLVYSEEFLDTQDPAADRLERLLGVVLDQGFPRPRLWYYPDAAVGVFLMTHDDEAFGDPSRWMTEYEAEIEARSSMLFQPGKRLTADGAAAMLADGTEVGLHWNRLERAGADYRSQTWLGVEWSRRRTSLSQQTAWLRELLPPGTASESARTHFLTWGPDYGSAFRALAAEGYLVDSSYGVDFGERGYLFGTGRPFQALDRNGLPLPIWEIPHLMAEDLAGDQKWLERLLAASAATEHQVINVLFHPSNMDWRPSVPLYELWKSSYDLARAHEHELLTLAELTRFWRRRTESRVEIQEGADSLRIVADVVGPGHSVVLPASWRGRSLVPGRSSLRVQEGIRESLLIPVPPGSSSLEVRLVQP